MSHHIEAKMAVVLGELNRALCDYLARVLPRLQPADWWERLVVGKLSQQQAERLRQTRGGDLHGLDLAALLRVFDANWWEICNRDSLPSECRHYLKEMQSVRNRWAHTTAALPPADTIFRDLDTAQRLLCAFAPDHPAVSALDDLKRHVLQAPSPNADSAPPPPPPSQAGPVPVPPSSPLFAPGSLVRLKSDPGKTGVVMTAEVGHPEDRLVVFIDGASRPFYVSQLLPDSGSAGAEIEIAAAEHFHACLTATHLAHPCGATLFSLNAARIDFIPYQFRPVIKFIRADLPRLLIADSVGVGKTIEAGLILRELQARHPLANVLIICPRPLVAEEKWKTEMRRFDERFVHLDGPALQHCVEEMHLEGEWDPRYSRAIVPYSLFDERLLHGEKGRRKRKGLLDLNPPPRFDLVIVDEAHHIRNPNTYAHQAVRFFCDHAEAVLFMTATPLQTSDADLFVLLNALRPDWVIDPASFAEMAAPNPHVNRAATVARGGTADWRPAALEALDAAAGTSWGKAIYPADPAYVKARRLLEAPDCDNRSRIEAISAIESLHTFAGLINRTRRRDIGDFAVRKPETVAVDFTPAQRQLHDGLLAMHRLLLTRCHDTQCVDFMMTTLKRQAASCIFGLAPMLGDILGRRLDELQALAEDGLSSLDETLHEALREAAAALVREAASLPPADPKFDALLRVVAGKRQSPNPRIMLFSTFLHTLRYLEAGLKAAAGVRVGLVHGGVPDPERMALRRRFMLPTDDAEAIDLLLFSEVGCEGLDYQFCDTLVNYDLPWNPMRIEQRIGRLDRNGQQSEAVFIYNLITNGTIDADIYSRCLLRIGIFERSVGECEDILGDLTRDIRAVAADTLLSDGERQAKLQQLADNQLRLAAERSELEQSQKAFFGLDLSDQRFRDDIDAACSSWLAPRAVENLVDRYLRSLAADTSPMLGGGKVKTLRLSHALRDTLLAELKAADLPASEALRRWRKLLADAEQYIKVAFESAAAANDSTIELLSPLHPLVRLAARQALAESATCHAALEVRCAEVPAGIHPFVVHEWRREGVRPEVELKPVCADPRLQARLGELLPQATTWRMATAEFPAKTIFDALEADHYQLWTAARDRHREETRALAEHRLRSLQTSHQARCRVLEQQIEQATDDRIRRMRTSQLTAANHDRQRRQTDLETAVARADIHTQPIAWGVLKVEGCHVE